MIGNYARSSTVDRNYDYADDEWWDEQEDKLKGKSDEELDQKAEKLMNWVFKTYGEPASYAMYRKHGLIK